MGRAIQRHTVLASALLTLGASPLLGQTDVSGRWHFHYFRFGEEVEAERADVKSDGTRVTGTLGGLKLDGTIENDRLRFTATGADGKDPASFEGRVSGRQGRRHGPLSARAIRLAATTASSPAR